MCINFGHYDFGYEKLLQVLTCSATYLDAHCSILIPKFWLLRISLFHKVIRLYSQVFSLQNYLHKCEDTYFVRLTKYLHIYEDTLGWRYLERIAHLGCIWTEFSAQYYILRRQIVLVGRRNDYPWLLVSYAPSSMWSMIAPSENMSRALCGDLS